MLIKTFITVLTLNVLLTAEPDSVTVFLVKQSWHTGIVIERTEVDSVHFPEIRNFSKFKYIDIGWGDNEFYRHPDFDIMLAVKALFIPTTSALRIEGFSFDIVKYIAYSDISYSIKMSRNSFDRLCSYISSTFRKTGGSVDLIEERYSGNIQFYFAEGKYSLLNTCNTWVAKGFLNAGFEIDIKIVLADELFDEIRSIPQSQKLK